MVPSWNSLTLMTSRKRVNGPAIRYSEAFKQEVVRELEQEDLSFEHMRRKYGIAGAFTVQRWVREYGNGTRGKVIRVERPEEIDEKKRLEKRVEQLERLLADANIEIALEKAYAKMALERAGIEDVEAFKKKADAKRFKKH